MQKYVDFIQLKIIKLSFIFLILILQSSCSLPFRLKAELIRGPSQTSKTFSNCATAETLIENVHAESIEEEVFKLSNAKIVIVDYDLIRKDFSRLTNKSNEDIDKWILDQVGYISKPQSNQTIVNSSVPITQETRKAFRPPHYGRALVYEMKHPETGEHLGLMDIKGAGSLSPGQIDHRNGIASLGESMREFLWENLMRDVLADANLPNKTVASYAVIDPGFDLKHSDGSSSRAGFYLRQGHSRLSKQHGAWLPETEKMRIQKVLHKYGIDPNRNIQATQNHDLFDFEHFILRDDLTNINSEKQIPFHLWGYDKSIPIQTGDRRFYSNKDYIWNWSHEFAKKWSKGAANRDDAHRHFQNLIFSARKILNNGTSCCDAIRRKINQ
jgi:hypothetical protein